MSYLSLEQPKNEFKIYRVNNKFSLNRNITELVDASDLISMQESLIREIDAYKTELKNLEDKKAEFDKWVEKAKLIKDSEKDLAQKQMQDYLKRSDVKNNNSSKKSNK